MRTELGSAYNKWNISVVIFSVQPTTEKEDDYGINKLKYNFFIGLYKTKVDI